MSADERRWSWHWSRRGFMRCNLLCIPEKNCNFWTVWNLYFITRSSRQHKAYSLIVHTSSPANSHIVNVIFRKYKINNKMQYNLGYHAGFMCGWLYDQTMLQSAFLLHAIISVIDDDDDDVHHHHHHHHHHHVKFTRYNLKI